jgi:hypothetical protein
MEKFKNLLKSKKFWTLIAALVAAFAAFFTTSCSASHYVAQSVSSFVKGDTTTTVIKYEQVGSFKKK